jgi:hypothetical protein
MHIAHPDIPESGLLRSESGTSLTFSINSVGGQAHFSTAAHCWIGPALQKCSPSCGYLASELIGIEGKATAVETFYAGLSLRK